jgi:hypothetical protein
MKDILVDIRVAKALRHSERVFLREGSPECGIDAGARRSFAQKDALRMT